MKRKFFDIKGNPASHHPCQPKVNELTFPRIRYSIRIGLAYAIRLDAGLSRRVFYIMYKTEGDYIFVGEIYNETAIA